MEKLRQVRGEDVMSVAERWRRQYQNADGVWTYNGKSIYERLRKLTRKSTPQDVATIIGNTSWVGHRCSECKRLVRSGVRFGGEYDESPTVLCRKCLKAAAKLLAA